MNNRRRLGLSRGVLDCIAVLDIIIKKIILFFLLFNFFKLMDFEMSEMDQGLAAQRQRHEKRINRENGASNEKIN